MATSFPEMPATPAPLPPQYTAWRGPQGVRAGWRVLIFLLLVGAIFAAFAITFAIVWQVVRQRAQAIDVSLHISGLTPLGLGLSETAIFIFPVLASLIMARIEHRRFGHYGLPLHCAFRRNFWIGILTGFLAISACLLGIYAFHGFQVTGLSIHGSTIVSASAAWGLAFLMVGLAEEFGFRGYLQFTLTTGMGFWPAAFLLSSLFGLAHAGNPGESRAGLVSVVLFGLLFCLFLRRSGNLWLPVGFHAGWDWGQTFFYGVPDSGIVPYHNLLNSSFHGSRWLTGGTVGPEASVFTPIVLAMVALWFSRVYPVNVYQTSDPRPQTSAAETDAPHL